MRSLCGSLPSQVEGGMAQVVRTLKMVLYDEVVGLNPSLGNNLSPWSSL